MKSKVWRKKIALELNKSVTDMESKYTPMVSLNTLDSGTSTKDMVTADKFSQMAQNTKETSIMEFSKVMAVTHGLNKSKKEAI